MAFDWSVVPVVGGGLGVVIGVADAVGRGDDVLKGGWDGLMLGAVAPGMAVGAVSGVVLGAVVHGVVLQPYTEPAWVGWGSAGAVAGGLVSHVGIVETLGESGIGRSGAIALDVGYLGYSTVLGIQTANSVQKKYTLDSDMHYMFTRQIRSFTDPGAALLMGATKEAGDYFFSTGHAEWRDLQNDWEGTFRGGRRY